MAVFFFSCFQNQFKQCVHMHAQQTVNFYDSSSIGQWQPKVIHDELTKSTAEPYQERKTHPEYIWKQKKECNMINVRLQGRQGSTAINIVLSFPMICAPLPSSVEDDQYLHLQRLELAEARSQ